MDARWQDKLTGRIVNIHWPDRIANKELWKKSDQEPVLDQLKRRKRNWLAQSEEMITARGPFYVGSGGGGHLPQIHLLTTSPGFKS